MEKDDTLFPYITNDNLCEYVGYFNFISLYIYISLIDYYVQIIMKVELLKTFHPQYLSYFQTHSHHAHPLL